MSSEEIKETMDEIRRLADNIEKMFGFFHSEEPIVVHDEG